ncbi:MAG: helix-turn-helix domain-containing protein [Lachnospiraceae bacterium]
MNYQLIGKRIQEKRKKKNISQKEMARYLNFSYQHLSNIERGISGISLELLVRISDLLQVSLDYLLQDSLQHPYQGDNGYFITDMEDYLLKQQTEIFELQKLITKTKKDMKKV